LATISDDVTRESGFVGGTISSRSIKIYRNTPRTMKLLPQNQVVSNKSVARLECSAEGNEWYRQLKFRWFFNPVNTSEWKSIREDQQNIGVKM
jgi:hypothetical protein